MTVSHLLRAIRSTRTIAGVTLVLILVACTGPTDPLGSRETGGGRREAHGGLFGAQGETDAVSKLAHGGRTDP